MQKIELLCGFAKLQRYIIITSTNSADTSMTQANREFMFLVSHSLTRLLFSHVMSRFLANTMGMTMLRNTNNKHNNSIPMCTNTGGLCKCLNVLCNCKLRCDHSRNYNTNMLMGWNGKQYGLCQATLQSGKKNTKPKKKKKKKKTTLQWHTHGEAKLSKPYSHSIQTMYCFNISELNPNIVTLYVVQYSFGCFHCQQNNIYIYDIIWDNI